MKEYKVVELGFLSLTKRAQKIEDIINQYALDGWRYVDIPYGQSCLILERDKNR